MKLLIRCRHKEHLRPRAHIWIDGDTLCKRVSNKTIKKSKYMLVDRTDEYIICQNCLERENRIWNFIEDGDYKHLGGSNG